MKNIRPGYSVIVLRDITRTEGLYATRGETGTVIKIFRPISTGSGEKKPPYAQVSMHNGDGIKTFRLTSLQRI